MHWLINAIYFSTILKRHVSPLINAIYLTTILKRHVSPAIHLCMWYLCVWYFGYMYVVGEGKVLCDVLREFKLLDCLNLLLFVQYTYNLDLYKVQRSAMIFLEKERNQPLQWTLITKSLLVLLKFLLCWVSEGLRL